MMKDVILNRVMRQGTIGFPDDLLWHYKSIGLTEEEFMALLLLMAYGQKKSDFYPELKHLASIMMAPVSRVQELIASLMEKDCLSIEKEFSLEDGQLSPAFCFEPLFRKLGTCISDADAKQRERRQEEMHAQVKQEDQPRAKDIYSIFEDEFGRPLTNMEIAYLSEWIEGDQFSDTLVLEALRSAVSREKLNFKYIDAILRDWRRKNITNAKQARKEDQAGRRTKKTKRVSKHFNDPPEKKMYDDLVINLME